MTRQEQEVRKCTMKNMKQSIKFSLVDWQWKRDQKRAQPKCTDKKVTVDLEKI